MSRLHSLAVKESFHRLPETCPSLHQGGTDASFTFNKWLDDRFGSKLSEGERTEISYKHGDAVAAILENAKETGTRPLRAALIAEIELGYRTSMSASRIAQIEAGVDPENTTEEVEMKSPEQQQMEAIAQLLRKPTQYVPVFLNNECKT